MSPVTVPHMTGASNSSCLCRKVLFRLSESRLHHTVVLQDEPLEGSSGDETQFASPPGVAGYHLTETQEVVNVDSERSLVVIRASKGSTDLSMGDGHFSASLAVDAFEIEDLLVGPRCPAHAYLARSFVATREQLLRPLKRP